MEPGDEECTFAFDDIPPNTKLKIVSGEDSFVEYERSDGSFRRLLTLKGGGPIRIRTDPAKPNTRKVNAKPNPWEFNRRK